MAVSLLLAACLLIAPSCGKREKPVTETEPVVATALMADGLQLCPSGHEIWLGGSFCISLYQGDMIQSGPSGKILLLFADGAVVFMNNNCTVRLDSTGADPTRIMATRGELWISCGAGSGVQVETPSATATAGHAEFGVSVEPGGSATVAAADESVMVENKAGAVKVAESSSARATVGEAPEPWGEETMSGASSWVPGFWPVVMDQIDPYFGNEASRDEAESTAQTEISLGSIGKWPHLNLGRALLDKGNVDGALAEFEKALSIDPQFPQAISGKGRCLLMKGGWSQAAESFKHARRVDRNSLEALTGIGHASLGCGNLNEAEKWYKEALELDSGDAGAWTALGVVKLLKGDKEGSAKDLENSATLRQSLGRTQRWLGILYALQGKTDLEVKHFQKALDIEPLNYRICNTLGCHYLRQGKTEKASDYFGRERRSDDADFKAIGYENLGFAKYSSGDFSGALESWEKSRDLRQGVAPVLVDMASSRIKLGEYVSAIESLLEAVSLDPENWYYHRSLAGAYWTAGMLPSAKDEARRSLQLNPADWASRIILGFCLYGDSKEDASSEISQARDLAPESGLSAYEHGLLGKAFELEKSYKPALAEYELAIELFPKSGTYHRYAGEVLSKMKQSERALEEYRAAAELNPADVEAVTGMAELLYSGGKKKEAMKELEDAAIDVPDSPEIRILLARYLLKEGEEDEAYYELSEARKIKGLDPLRMAEIVIATGEMQDENEDYQSAVSSYREALTLDPLRGDAWFYLAKDLERLGEVAGAREAYGKALELCRDKAQWKQMYREASKKLE